MDPLNKNVEAQPSGVPLQAGFDECNPKYMCFRNRYHVTKGSLFIIYLMIGLTVIYTLTNGYAMTVGSDRHLKSTYGENYLGVVLLVIALQTIVLGSALFGLQRQKRHYLIPFLVVMAIGCFFSGIKAVLVLSVIDEFGATAFLLFFVYIFVTLLDGYSFYIVLLCHDYWATKLREEEIAAAVSAAWQRQPAPVGNAGIPQSEVPSSYDYHNQQPPPAYQGY